MKIPRSKLAYARSSDKGDGSNVGVVADSRACGNDYVLRLVCDSSFASKLIVTLSAIVLALFLLDSAFGAQADFKDRFAGRWVVDKEKYKKYFREHFGEDDEAIDKLPKITFEFRASGASTITCQESPDGEIQTSKGDWKLIEKVDENHAKVCITEKVDGEESIMDATVEFVDDDTLVITTDPDSFDQWTLVMARSSDESKKNDDSPSDKKDKHPD